MSGFHNQSAPFTDKEAGGMSDGEWQLQNQEVAAAAAAVANKISLDAKVAVLSEPDGIFTLKEELKKMAQKV